MCSQLNMVAPIRCAVSSRDCWEAGGLAPLPYACDSVCTIGLQLTHDSIVICPGLNSSTGLDPSRGVRGQLGLGFHPPVRSIQRTACHIQRQCGTNRRTPTSPTTKLILPTSDLEEKDSPAISTITAVFMAWIHNCLNAVGRSEEAPTAQRTQPGRSRSAISIPLIALNIAVRSTATSCNGSVSHVLRRTLVPRTESTGDPLSLSALYIRWVHDLLLLAPPPKYAAEQMIE